MKARSVVAVLGLGLLVLGESVGSVGAANSKDNSWLTDLAAARAAARRGNKLILALVH